MEEIRRLKDDIGHLRRTIQYKDIEIRKGFETNEALRRDSNSRICDLQKQNQELQTQLNRQRGNSGSVEDLHRKLEASEYMNSKVKEFNVKLRERKESADEKVKQLQEEILVRSQQSGTNYHYNHHSDICREITKLRAEVAKLNDENYKIITDKRTSDRRNFTLQETCKKLQKDNETLSKYSDNLKKDLEFRCKAHESLMERTKEEEDSREDGGVKKRLEELNAMSIKLENDRADIHKQRDRLSTARKEHANEKQRWAEENNHLTMENENLKKKVEQLQQKCEQLERERVPKRTKVASGPDSSNFRHSHQSTSQRSYSSADVHMVLQSQTIVVAQLQQDMVRMQTELNRVTHQNTRYRDNAGKVQTTLREYSRSYMNQDEQTLDILAGKVAALLQMDNQPPHQHDYIHHMPSYHGAVSSDYPAVQPFKAKETRHHVLDLTKPSLSDDNNHPNNDPL